MRAFFGVSMFGDVVLNFEILSCPVCKKPLSKTERSYICPSSHNFDEAKEGYVNLLSGSHKQGELIGDNKSMALSRRDFLNKGYFSSLANGVCDVLKSENLQNPNVLDICCGEGYYSEYLSKRTDCNLYGFDISKNMVRLAAKRKLDAVFFVANLSHIPIFDGSVDFAFHLFAPFHDEEFSRVLKKGGVLVTAVPGKNHLWELKSAVYDTPYQNDEKLPESRLTLERTIKISNTIKIDNNEDIMSLFKMTPYYYRTSKEGIERAEKLETLETTLEFVLGVYRK